MRSTRPPPTPPATSDPLPDRLRLAIDHLTVRQVEVIQQRAATLSCGPGLRTQIAALCQMPTASTLSDMMSGRIPGTKYQEALAELLQISVSWLNGDDNAAPDWALSPLVAWERFAGRVQLAWNRKTGRASPVSDDDSQTGIPVTATDEHRIARMLGLPLGSLEVTRIATQRYALCPFDALVRFAQALDVPPLLDAAHVEHGQSTARMVSERVEHALVTAKRRYQRYLLPPRLFRMVRLGLSGIKAQRQHQGKELRAVDDALEVLWRQHLLRSNTAKRELPSAFFEDTGRGAWTPLNIICQRYPDDEDPGEPWETPPR